MDQTQIDAARKLAAEAKARAEKATPGPWCISIPTIEVGYTHGAIIWGVATPGDDYGWVADGVNIGEMAPDDNDYDYVADDGFSPIRNSNGDFVAAARTDVPALADLVDQLAAALEQEQAEIRRLNQDLSDELIRQSNARLAAAEAENTRLREALGRIANCVQWHEHGFNRIVTDGVVVDTARAALNPEAGNLETGGNNA